MPNASLRSLGKVAPVSEVVIARTAHTDPKKVTTVLARCARDCMVNE